MRTVMSRSRSTTPEGVGLDVLPGFRAPLLNWENRQLMLKNDQRKSGPRSHDDSSRGTMAMNDPRGSGPGGQGPREPQGGPPDLDELWRDFNRRLSRLFGRKGGGSGLPQRPGHAGRNTSLIVVGLLIAVWLGNGVFVVPDGQTGVVMRFGQYRHTTPAGVQWRLPFPIESNELVNVAQVRSVDVGRANVVPSTNMKDASMLTRDGDIVDVRFTVQFRVSDASAFLFNNVDPESAVTQAAQVAAREIVGKRSLDDMVNGSRADLGTQLNTAIQASLDRYKAGIELVGVTVQSAQAPEQVQGAFADALKAAQDRDNIKTDARTYGESILPKARSDAAALIAQAQAYKERVVTEAQGNATHFEQVLTEYQKAPAVTRERMYIETMQQIYTNATKVLIDSRSGNNTVYLPLDKLLAMNGVTPRTDVSATTAPAAAPSTASAAAATTAPGNAAAASLGASASAASGAASSLGDSDDVAGNAGNTAASSAAPAATAAPDASTAAPSSDAASGDRAQLFRSREDSKDIR
jgi:modulator of FtsH protease HflK